MNKQADALANVYARSLFELAIEAGGNEKVAEIADEIEQISELLASNSELNHFFSSPIIDIEKRNDALSVIFSNKVTDLTLRFLLVLNSKGRLYHLLQIANAYDQLVQDALGKVEVDVITPSTIDDSALGAIKAKVQELLGKEPILHTYVDASMLGGVKLKIGDQLIDGSVATKLRRISESVQSGGSVAIRERFETYLENNA